MSSSLDEEWGAETRELAELEDELPGGAETGGGVRASISERECRLKKHYFPLPRFRRVHCTPNVHAQTSKNQSTSR